MVHVNNNNNKMQLTINLLINVRNFFKMNGNWDNERFLYLLILYIIFII